MAKLKLVCMVEVEPTNNNPSKLGVCMVKETWVREEGELVTSYVYEHLNLRIIEQVVDGFVNDAFSSEDKQILTERCKAYLKDLPFTYRGCDSCELRYKCLTGEIKWMIRL